MRLISVIGVLVLLCASAAAQTLERGDRHGANRGLNNFVIYAGFSVFK